MRRALAVVLLVVASNALASAPHTAPKIAADTLTAMPAAGVDKPLRTYRDVVWGAAHGTDAWNKFTAAAGGRWEVVWDRATGVPLRIWGSGIAAPGAMASPAIAEGVARAWLADHLALLAPGAQASDFVLVSNVSDGDIRSIGFLQKPGGREVVGGQVSFELKKDRLFVIGSTALPNVAVPTVQVHVDRATLLARAQPLLRDQLGLPNGQVTTEPADVIVPLVADGGVLGYRLAAPLTIDGGAAGKYRAYVDVSSGAPLAVEQQNRYATGTVLYNEVNRYPNLGYTPKPAPHVFVQIAGGMATTDDNGVVTWSDGDQTLTTSVSGDYVTVVDCAVDAKCPGSDSGMPTVTAMMPISPAGSATWDESADEQADAQVQAYLSLNIVKAFVRDNVDASMPGIDMPLTAHVNLDQTCNAFFDGKTVNYFHADKQCQNTARIQDVVFHEFGHDLHESEIIKGVGKFDGAMSEGAADFLAVNVTGDPGMGRGFFYDDTPLRDLDPPLGKEWTWPQDIGEIHHTGLIFGGTFWDLRKDAEKVYGVDAGDALVRKLYLGALRHAVDIPSCLIAALETDDDDGDLSDGTPNECMIRKEFARHGLTTASGFIDGPGATNENALATQITMTATNLSPNCGQSVAAMQVTYGPGDTGQPAMGSVDASPATANTYYAQIPLALHGDVLFQPQIELFGGGRVTLPDNLADPQYQLYSGTTVPLYCTDFESADPLTMGWTTTTADGSPSPWAWGVPSGGTTDPPSAFSGTHALVQALGGDYPAMQTSQVSMPPIEVGQYSDVRLQYRRWLAVEDSHFDQAQILTNGTQVWENATANNGDSSSLQHVDKEWRFQDVGLSGHFSGHALTVSWSLTSDDGVQFGGWALDDVCVVANPLSICGDGVQSPTEQCDDGAANADKPDACRTDCSTPKCGDGIVDTGEQCDGSADCTPDCKLQDVSGGCCSTGGDLGGSLALTAMVACLCRRRRRAA